ncbi:precorrin-8X methylmutase [Lutispora thermophila]|uniref:Precorrin-8X methylmutase n=1 Tax=Lutispora thermophila DSM 19022 TaxID=1122184 RepID=A0A1M6D3A4_9FIRM|nr:precorrin-8X methylmutase [Lutispora thermophila]SHI67679.1 precorrin-8X methylmutase [Lutispora thermophila DSM 19022]
MLEGIEIIKPGDIEEKSFEILAGILGDREFSKEHEPIIKRVIHTTADFEYADLINISDDAVESAFNAIRGGGSLVTDTKMALAGINKKNLAKYGGQVYCFMDDEDVAAEAKARNITRASLCMEKASKNSNIRIYVIGNAPTALIRLYELISEGVVDPALVIGVPVGFVNVIESKEMIKKLKVPYIITEGRKGGSNVAAAIVNAILYMMGRD